ncbi:helix-turn-helix DNA binding domain protein [Rhodococcus phage Reynauld]|uniref:Helix-turn-helix DNA binding domain protein n=1 Tax=Rhodococcus phage Reynauld TaxID=3062845 RepID=A0ACD4UKW7_9CAUD|nr:helix-turn-helix DNA binding domain protein [Rhodococcus phage Reynauld]
MTDEATEKFIRGMTKTRIQLGMTQAELQRKVFGFDGPEINRHERGHVKRISLSRALQISRAMGYSIEVLVEVGES